MILVVIFCKRTVKAQSSVKRILSREFIMKKISLVTLILSAAFGFSATTFAGHCGGNHTDMKDDKKHSEADHKAAETKAETSETESESSS